MIHEIEIKNFKSLRDLRVELSPLTVLIGRSGTGKSNFIDAIRFLRGVLTLQLNHAAAEFGGLSQILSATHSDDSYDVSICVKFDVPGSNELFTYRISFDFRSVFGIGGGRPAESLDIGGKLFFAHASGEWSNVPKMSNAPLPNGIMLSNLYGVPEIRTAFLVLTHGLGFYDFPGDVLCKPEKPTGTVLTSEGKNFVGALAAIVNDISDFDRRKEMMTAVGRLNHSVATLDVPQDASKVIVGHQIASNMALTFDLNQESEGFRRFLAHLIAMYQKPTKTVVTFEEPEKGIYPGALHVLLDSFRRFIERERGQIILTTHSPELLDCVKLDEIRVVEMDGYETKIGPVSASQSEALREHLLTTSELLTADEARINDASPSA